MLEFIDSPEVAEARRSSKPILALESTIITHGMPYPQNVEMVHQVENIAREAGVTPASIAVIEGKIHIGLTEDNLQMLAKAKNVSKLSRADLADCIARGGTGATTVAATMILAERAGISVFATGGIGGVHRDASHSFDISADLTELARTNVIVVSAGAKAILDIPKTVEYLETQGVPIYGYGCDELPAFYSHQSGIPAPLRANTAQEIARAFETRAAMGLKGGVLIANPIPKDNEIPSSEIEPIIDNALKAAEAQNIRAKAVTPFLLDQLYKMTQGRSLTANIALVENNVRLAAQIALALAENQSNYESISGNSK